MISAKAGNMDQFIAAFSVDVQDRLRQIRMTIRKAAPEAGEKISYGIPTFSLHGNLVHFSAYRNHIGFYPSSSGIRAFQKELSGYTCSKGTVRFSFDKPLPLGLIAKMVRFRVRENKEKARNKKPQKK